MKVGLTKYCVLLALLTLFLSIQVSSQTNIPAGNVNGKWTKQNSPYYINGEIKIPRGEKLIVEPGVKIIFNGHYKFIVYGILEAKGIENDSIYFTPSNKITGWFGLRFIEAEEKSIVSHCILEYGVAIANIDSLKKTERFKNTPIWGELNEVSELNGGAINIYKSSPVIQYSSIRYSYAECNGGGIWIYERSNPLIINCKIYNNTSNQFDGGGICCYKYSNPIIRNCIISGNRTIQAGGGGLDITVRSNPLVENCIFENNYALNSGGISLGSTTKAIIKNCLIKNNYALITGGIGVSRTNSSLINLIIENNHARDYCGGIYFEDTNLRVEGLIVRNNHANVCGGVQIQGYPRPVFSKTNKSNVYLNIARENANDFYTTSFDAPKYVILDTFTVDQYSELQVYPLDKMIVTADNFKITKSEGPLYVNPDGDDKNNGTSRDKPLKTLNVALTKILSDSTNPGIIYLEDGIYASETSNDILKLSKVKFVTLKGSGLSSISLGAEGITVFTPWWNTLPAFLIYTFLIIFIFIFIWKIRSRRIRIRNELEKQKFEAQKLHEVDEIKTRFFTNISHEFRTPLTLILGPSRQLLESTSEEKTKVTADLIHRSANKLNRLVDELLDISKIEAGEMRLKASPKNLVVVVKEIALSFNSLAERKRIAFKLISNPDELIVYIDRDKVDKILTNVLSNAFKFTPEGGSVNLEINRIGENAEIKIADSGTGIPQNQLNKIFDRFYQVDSSHTREHEGTGIGLALTKELVELHKGRIAVESEEGKGTTFYIIIPLGKEHLKANEIYVEETEKVKESEKDIPELSETIDPGIEDKFETDASEKPILLIVEDNPDVRKYINMILLNEYKIFEAKDGEEGLDISFEQIPDLIISDIMMPKIDGMQMCSKLKTDSRTSHIPIIMLTAKATMKDKIHGLELGVDEYLMKPFEAEELKARIKNLLEQRKRLHEHFHQYGMVDIEQKKITSIDQQFLKKVVAIINEHIPDASFGVEILAEDLAVSHSLLYKKLTALVGVSPIELIKKSRLNKAAKLIESNSGNISEIALEVGFNNPAYFSEAFKKQFGISPSKYHHNNRTI